MSNQTSEPGLEGGMFFEIYFFNPLTNFTEADLPAILKFYDMTLNEGTECSHPRHFDENRVFRPQDDLTVSEFADILMDIDLRVHGDMLAKMPDEVAKQFDDEGCFAPWEDYTLAELNMLLTKVFRFRVSTTEFNTLPRRLQRQFMVYTRDGQTWRFGDRRPG